MKIRTVLEAIGAALLLLPWYLPFVDPTNLAVYHYGLPVTNLIGGLLVDLLCVAFLTLGFLIAIQYLPAVAQKILQALFAGFMLWRIVDFAFRVWFITTTLENTRQQLLWDSARKQCCIVILLLFVVLTYSVPLIAQPAVRAVRLVIAAFAFSVLWIIPQLLHLALIRQPEATPASLHPAVYPPGVSNRRIIWILFDELSYDQTFDHPASGMELPNFNRLRTESVSFSNLDPAGFYTDLIIPSLFLDRRIDQIRSTVDSDLRYKDETQNRWLAYDPNATLFALAQRNGWTTGVDGWHIPYCHILASVLNVCSWEASPYAIPETVTYGTSEDKPVLANAAALWNLFLAKLTNRTPKPNLATAHIEEYRHVMARTQALIENEQVRFVFLHLPVPHPPGIYDRQRHMLRPGGTYLDNLVLTDQTLGVLLQEIDATPSASRTTVIVSSDHSWRIPMLRGNEDWSAEEERASGGHFDQRPVLLIHFPGQTSGADMPSALPELLEHDMIAAMLLGKIDNQEDLTVFLLRDGR
jgi:hypothetical protein